MVVMAPSPTVDKLPSESSQTPYDLVVVGFGPAQLAIAIALQEAQSTANVVFLEREGEFTWHPESHLPRMRMEHSFMYDLVTTRNPRSNYTYLQYLHGKNRLVDFANMSQLRPLREEFEDYLRWCARHFEGSVAYANEVVSVMPTRETDSTVRQWNVKVRDRARGKNHEVRARNIVLPAGKRLTTTVDVPPPGNESTIPAEEYLARREELRQIRDPPINITVVGSSNQAVEIVDDLVSCPRLGNITFITRNEALRGVKDLEASTAPPQEKPLCSIWAKKQTSNDSTYPPEPSELINHIYFAAYEKRIASKGKYRLRVMLEEGMGQSVKSDITIREKDEERLPHNSLWREVDPLVLTARRKGKSLEELQFKRGIVAEQSKIWTISASEGLLKDGGRSLATDIAVRAGEIAKTLSDGLEKSDHQILANPRI